MDFELTPAMPKKHIILSLCIWSQAISINMVAQHFLLVNNAHGSRVAAPFYCLGRLANDFSNNLQGFPIGTGESIRSSSASEDIFSNLLKYITWIRYNK